MTKNVTYSISKNDSTQHEERICMQQSSKRSRRMRYIIASIFGILAVLSVTLGVMNATVWKPEQVIIAHARVSGAQYIVTDPGVMNLVDSRVRISAAVEKSRKPVCIAVGLTKDIKGWTSGSSVQHITGLKDWKTLSVKLVKSQEKMKIDKPEDPDVPFKQSDMWSEANCQLGLAKLSADVSDFVQSSNAASYDHAVSMGNVDKTGKNKNVHNDDKGANNQASEAARSQKLNHAIIIDLGSNNRVAHIEMRWRRHSIPDFVTPWYLTAALFAVLMVLAATVFAMSPHRRRNQRIVAKRNGSLRVTSERREEVSFSEAFAGTMVGLFGKSNHHKGSAGAHARHGTKRHVYSQSDINNANTVSISVRTNENSDSNSDNNSEHSSSNSLEDTTVISPDELKAYFARLAKEDGVSLTVDNAAEKSDSYKDSSFDSKKNNDENDMRSNDFKNKKTRKTSAHAVRKSFDNKHKTQVNSENQQNSYDSSKNVTEKDGEKKNHNSSGKNNEGRNTREFSKRRLNDGNNRNSGSSKRGENNTKNGNGNASETANGTSRGTTHGRNRRNSGKSYAKSDARERSNNQKSDSNEYGYYRKGAHRQDKSYRRNENSKKNSAINSMNNHSKNNYDNQSKSNQSDSKQNSKTNQNENTRYGQRKQDASADVQRDKRKKTVRNSNTNGQRKA